MLFQHLLNKIMNDPDNKPDAPKGWTVHWSKRKNRWYWADAHKTAYWKLPNDAKISNLTTCVDNNNMKPKVNLSSILDSLSSVVTNSGVHSQLSHDSSQHTTQNIPGISRIRVADDIQLSSCEPNEIKNDTSIKRKYVRTDDGFHEHVSKRACCTSRTNQTSNDEQVTKKPNVHDDTEELKSRNEHYSSVANELGSVHKKEREETIHSRMIKHSNWVKSILIESALRVFGGGVKLNCMDLACGRGGDLHKWNKATRKFKQHIVKFYGIDSAEGCIHHCRVNRSKILARETDAKWIVENLETANVFERLCATAALAPSSIHVVSMQFALHYFFRTEKSLRSVFQLLSKSMTKGGIFVCAYSDGNAIVRLSREQRWKDSIEATKSLKSGDTYYEKSSVTVKRNLFSIEMNVATLDAIETSTDPYGHGYIFTLGNYVRSQKEYLVVDSELDTVAESFGFYSIMEENFHPLTHAAIKVEKHKESMRIMRVFGNEPEFSDDDWESLGLYKARIFVYDPTGNLYKPKAKEWVNRYLMHCTGV